MGLLDSLGGLVGQDGSINYSAIADFIQQHGGVSGLVQQFQQSGLGAEVNSWLSSGQNTPVSSDQVKQAVNSNALQDLATKLGADPNQVSGMLAQHLPQLISALSNGSGNVPGGSSVTNELISTGLNLLKSNLLGGGNQ